MKQPHRHLPDCELEIMHIIWEKEPPVSRTEIESAVSADHPLASTTILTLLTRLCEKGFLAVEKQGRSNLYTPLVTQKTYLAGESRSLLNKLYGGSVRTFATALCDSGLTREELTELRDLLERDAL